VGMQLQHPLHDKHMLLISVQGWQACWNAAAASLYGKHMLRSRAGLTNL